MPAPGSALSLDMALAASAWAEFREARDALDAARAKLGLGGRGISRTAVTRLEQRCPTAEAGYRDARELLGKAAQRALARNRTTTA